MAQQKINTDATPWYQHRKRTIVFKAFTYFVAGFAMPIDITFFALPYLTSQILGPVATFYLAMTAGIVLGALFVVLSLYESRKANEQEKSKQRELDRFLYTQQDAIKLERSQIRIRKLTYLETQNQYLLEHLKAQDVTLQDTNLNSQAKKQYHSKSTTQHSGTPDEIKLLYWFKNFLGAAVLGVGLAWGIYGIRLISPYTQTGLLVLGTIGLAYGLVTAISEEITQKQNDHTNNIQYKIDLVQQEKKIIKTKIKRATEENQNLREQYQVLLQDTSKTLAPLPAAISRNSIKNNMVQEIQQELAAATAASILA